MLSILRDQVLVTAGIAKSKAYAVNDTIVSEGMADRCLYLIEKGSARVSGRVALADGRHIQPGLCDLSRGEIFGELSLFDAGSRSASVIALEDVEVLEFDALALERYLDQHPEQGYVVLKALLKILSSRLRQTDRRWEQLFAWGLKEHGIDQHL
ncbi:MAG: cyclic nucleotide-binding domain-containing protein [Gammaproteobacteria bacterium]|nr:cyclic nucleotide-binding domain-containing protein [Gammaproteobacteria bacterium]MBQ0838633.1 cyclic nucleotide-binding domain-containing protein [Gammaproteobacteria bacterium]